MMKNISILGSTGSIGRQSLDVIEKLEGIKVVALTAGTSVDLMADQCRKFVPELAVMASEEAAKKLAAEIADLPTRISWGEQGIRFISSIEKSGDFANVKEFGTILIPSADITDVSELVIGATLNGHTVAKVPAEKVYAQTDDTVTFTAVITQIAEKNYTRAYTARAYAILEDGRVVYSDTYASRSVYEVAKKGIENPDETEANKEVFRKIVAVVEGDPSIDNDYPDPWN